MDEEGICELASSVLVFSFLLWDFNKRLNKNIFVAFIKLVWSTVS